MILYRPTKEIQIHKKTIQRHYPDKFDIPKKYWGKGEKGTKERRKERKKSEKRKERRKGEISKLVGKEANGKWFWLFSYF